MKKILSEKNKIFLKLGIGFITILCASCATPYQPQGLMGGYNNFNLGDGKYTVVFKGNGFTSTDTVQQYLMRRSAEITLNNGKRYFIVLGSADDSSSYSYYVPATSTTSGSGSVYGNNYNYQQTNTVYGGYSHTVYKPGEKIMIQILDNNRSGAFDAQAILSNFNI